VPQEDLLRGAVQPVNDYLGAFLATNSWSPKATGALVGLAQVAEVAVFIGVLGMLCAGLRSLAVGADGTIRRDRLGDALIAAAALAACALFYWSVRVPSTDISSLFGRWDHLAFCAATGFVISRVGTEGRKWILTGLSAYFMIHYTGRTPMAVVTGGGLIGFAALRLPGTTRPWPTAFVQAGILASVSAICWMMRSRNLLEALSTQGAFGFVLLRHISFVVEARRGLRARLGDYLCYMLFYPSFIGASEIYSEFAERNLSGATHYDYRTAVTKIVLGQLQIWGALQIETSFKTVLQIENTPLLWLNVLMLFVRSSLFVMGLWATIEGVALLYGFQLRPNFAGILTCENPAQFWRSWRATMTNWLIHYVYIPLGGNRRYQVRNIFAAFLVSTAWHWMGMPFFTLTPHLWDFVPIGVWGLINATAVAGYISFHKRGWRVLPAVAPNALRRGTKILLTACVASFTVTLLDFRPQTMDFFASFMRRLLGIG
jgi:hypothetical protein